MQGFPAAARWFLLLVLIALLSRYAWNHREEAPDLAQLFRPHVGVIWLGETLFILSNSMILRLLVGACGSELPYTKAFALTAASALVNYVAPLQAGLALRAFYLRDTHSFSMITLAAISAVVVLMNLTILGSSGLVCLWLLGREVPVSMLAVLILAAAGGLAALVIGRVGAGKTLPPPIERVIVGVRRLGRAPGSLARVALLLFLNSLILTFELWIAHRALNHPVPFGNVFLMNSMRVLTVVVTVTPGNLGVVEGVLAAAGTGVGQAFPVSLAAAGMLRLANMAAVLVWGGLSLLLWAVHKREET